MSINKETFSIGDLFKKIIQKENSKIHTSIPAEIVEVNSNNTVNVIPLIKDKDLNNEYKTLPVITNVPVQFFRTSVALISVPINKGDTGTLTFAERSIKNWQLQGGQQEPEDNRRFNLTDGYFCPNILKDGSGLSFNEDLQIVLKDAKVIIKDNGQIHIQNSSSSIIIKDGEVEVESNSIKLGASSVEPAVLGSTLQAAINTFIGLYNTHQHIASGPTPLPSFQATPLSGAELSTKTKIE